MALGLPPALVLLRMPLMSTLLAALLQGCMLCCQLLGPQPAVEAQE